MNIKFDRDKGSLIINQEKITEIPYVLPEGWVWTSINQLTNELTFFDGDWIVKKDMDGEGDIRLLQLGDIGEGSFLNKSEKFINEYTMNTLGCKEVKTGDILIARMPKPIGRSCIVPKTKERLITAVDVAVVRVNNSYISHDYLNYVFNSSYFNSMCKKQARGVTRKRITRKNLGRIPIPLPSLDVQLEIVRLLNQMLGKLERASDLIESAHLRLSINSNNIISEAIKGNLTLKWRKLNKVDIEGWTTCKFREFCMLKRGYDLPKRSRVDGNFPLVSSSGISDYIDQDKVKGPGVIVGRSGSIGKVHYTESNYWPLNTTLYSTDLFGNNPKYVYYYLKIFPFSRYGSSTAVPTLNRNKFLDETLRIPSVEEQNEIVRILDAIHSETEKFADIQYLRETVNTLKSNIISKSIRGDLLKAESNLENLLGCLQDLVGDISLLVKSNVNEKAQARTATLKKTDIYSLVTEFENGILINKLFEKVELPINQFYEKLEELIQKKKIRQANNRIYASGETDEN